MNRESSLVTYGHDDIVFIGEYKGKPHCYGYSVYFTTMDNQILRWNTVLPPTRTNRVELMWGKGPITIAYRVIGKDEYGTDIENVRFLNRAGR